MEKTLRGEFILNEHQESAGKDKQTTSVIHEEKPKQHHVHHTKPHFSSAFGDHPLGVTFAEQEEGEEIVLLLRRHFVTNVPWIAFAIFLALVPFLLPLIFLSLPFPDLSPTTLLYLMVFYYLFIFGFVLLNFALWYFHIGLITNLRIIDIDLAGILYRQVTAIKHESVEDVTYTQAGFIPSLFNYGNVHIQTAGNTTNVEFDRVPRPAKASDVISDLFKSCMSTLFTILEYMRGADNFTKVVLLVLLIFYSLYALVLAFQIFTYNRLMVQKAFAPIFQLIAVIHAVISFILLLLVVLTL